MTRGVCSVATTKKRVKILDFKLFYKHFVFIEKSDFDIKKVQKKKHRCERLFECRLRRQKIDTSVINESSENILITVLAFFIFCKSLFIIKKLAFYHLK